jgi:hypothetical protein
MTTPLRLADAVRIAFPVGGMTVSGLRREAARGRLVIERVAGRDFVTLAAIEEMRKLCRVRVKERACGSAPKGGTEPASGRPSGSSGTERMKRAQAAALATAERLRKRSPATSPQNTLPSEPGAVIHLKSQSQTS